MKFNYDNVQSEDRILIKLLFVKKILDIYELHTKYKLSPGQIARSLEKLLADNLLHIVEKENSIMVSLTDFGRTWLIENGNWVLFGSRTLHWKEIPKSFMRQSTSESKPFIPRTIELRRFVNDLISRD
jgi:DNA-binding PadR family transcriptional regulator